MGKHIRHGVAIDYDPLGAWHRAHLELPRHIAEPVVTVDIARMVDYYGLDKVSPLPYALTNPVGRATLEAEYRGMGIDPALIDLIAPADPETFLEVVKSAYVPPLRWVVGTVETTDAEPMTFTPEGSVILAYPDPFVASPVAHLPRRFTVKRLPLDVTHRPWCIRDAERPYWIGREQSHPEAIHAVDNIARDGWGHEVCS